MPRMHILTAVEHQAFDTPPVFSDAERAMFSKLVIITWLIVAFGEMDAIKG
jgi:hypothetical protein